LECRQYQHGVSLLDADAREQPQRNVVVFELAQQRRIEGQSLVVLWREREVVALPRVVEIEVVVHDGHNPRVRSREVDVLGPHPAVRPGDANQSTEDHDVGLVVTGTVVEDSAAGH